MENFDAKVIFTLEGKNSTIQCYLLDKMENICQKFAEKENKSVNTFLFLYEGNIVNLELSFKEYTNFNDINKNEINIIVYKIPKLKEKIDDIILSNNKIKDDINKFKLQIKRIIKIYLYKSINFQLNNME